MVYLRAVSPDDAQLRAIYRLAVDDPRNRTVPILFLIHLRHWVLVCQPFWGLGWQAPTKITPLQSWWIVLDLLEVS